ncbi:MAG: ABC transporter permease, partial [Alphaproteobacteria bacterium]|nr:ABC transporter permease [Alphaproteobacteria bacterium]
MIASLRVARHVVTENPVTLIAFLLFIFLVVLAVFGPAIAPHDPVASNVPA